MTTFQEALDRGRTTTEQALDLFDHCAPVRLEDMIGTWRGDEFPTGHPMDGLLSATGWYGKQFVDPETVHPLLFHTADHRAAFPVDPARIPMRLPMPADRGWSYHRVITAGRALLRASGPTARLRITEYRGRSSATMIYDARPINDVFARIDDDTLFGVMDLRWSPRPYFFVLRRDDGMTVQT